MWLLTAFLLGITGSLHCVGMCGPLIMALPVDTKKRLPFLGKMGIYHAGRVGVYVVLGLILGLAGKGFSMAGMQQGLSIASGIFLLTLVFMGLRAPTGKTGNWLYQLRSKLTGFIRKKGNWALFAAGTGNGLLPCGLVYAALAGAIAQGEILDGAMFMFLFGVGTIPALLFIPLIKNMFGGLQHYGKKLITVSAVIIAGLLIMRGLNLGIPYISPDMDKKGGGSCHAHTTSGKI